MTAARKLLDVRDYEAVAAERLEAGALGYYAGGADDERTLRDNVAAYERWRLRPRVLVDVEHATTATTVLGQEIALPLLVAPVAFQRVAHPDGEVGMARAARDAGTIMCLSTLATSTPAEVAEVGGPRWFQLYVFRDEGLTHELIAQARECGYGALLLTVDAPVRGNRERDARTGFAIPPEIRIASLGRGGLTPQAVFEQVTASLTWPDVERIVGEAELPLLVKGVLTADDARRALEHGIDGVIVSNHGGRQVDGAVAALDALVEVRGALPDAVVLMDGGIRTGADVLKAVALGADAVLLGRPYAYALAVGGARGVEALIEQLLAEVDLTLALLGAGSVRELDRSWLTTVV